MVAEVDRIWKVESRREKEHVVDVGLFSLGIRHGIGLGVMSGKEFRSISRQFGGKWENLRNDCRGEGGGH